MVLWFLLVIFACFGDGAIAQKRSINSDAFPVDAYLRPRVDFWKKVYTEISSKEAFLHDEEHLHIVYKKITYPSENPRERKRFSEKEKKIIQKILHSIVFKKRENLTAEENEILMIVAAFSDQELLQMGSRIRRQQGMSDRYYEGLVRAHPYLDKIQKIFAEENLPDELIYLPHVESSFNYRAYSKVGAAGMWQFMRSTARIYGLKMNYFVDERRDPIASTKSAARFLRDNFSKLQAWPLAVTAYNHGPKSIARAAEDLSTRDLSIIIQKYRNRRFGFASKNFYTTFMATVEISREPEKYFPNYPKETLPELIEVKLQRNISVDEIVQVIGASKEDLQDYNLSIRPAIFRSRTLLPKDFVLRIPIQAKDKIENFFTSVPRAIIAERKNIEKKELSKEAVIDEEIYSEAEPKGSFASDKEYTKVEEGEKTSSLASKIAEKTQTIQNSIARIFSTKPQESSSAAALPEAENSSSANSDFNPNFYDFSIEKMHKNKARINVEVDETLSHYAEWAKTTPMEIRRINRMRSFHHLLQGQKILIPLAEENFQAFREERERYHKSIEEDLFTAYKVSGFTEYVIKRGDTVGLICKKLDLPFWLLRKYQPNIGEMRLSRGKTITVPVLEPIRAIDEPAVTTTTSNTSE